MAVKKEAVKAAKPSKKFNIKNNNSFVPYLEDKLNSMDFDKYFISLNFDSLSIIIDNSNFSFDVDGNGMITYKKNVKPVIEIHIPIDKLQFISRGVQDK